MKPQRLLAICLLTLTCFAFESSQGLAAPRSGKAQIAFVRAQSYLDEGSLNLINYDGTDQRTLVKDMAGSFAWSPDGSQIAYAGEDGIYTINADGSNPTKIAGYDLGHETLDPHNIYEIAWTARNPWIVVHARANLPENNLLYIPLREIQSKRTAGGRMKGRGGG